MKKPPTKRAVRNLPETVSAFPDVSVQEIKSESNPFTSGDWRMLGYAWMGFAMRGLIVVGAVFSAYQYLEAREEKRVERTLQLVQLWERPEYQQAQQAVERRLAELNAQYADLLGKDPTASDLAVYRGRIGLAALNEHASEKPEAFRAEFDRLVYFLNRLAFCVDGNLCSAGVSRGYFGDFAISFWDYFAGFIKEERQRGSINFAQPIEDYVAEIR